MLLLLLFLLSFFFSCPSFPPFSYPSFSSPISPSPVSLVLVSFPFIFFPSSPPPFIPSSPSSPPSNFQFSCLTWCLWLAGFPMNVISLLPYLVEHYEENNKVCTEAADHISQVSSLSSCPASDTHTHHTVHTGTITYLPSTCMKSMHLLFMKYS